ncbi:hypothetical protein NHQ30_010147 [Ciborinia camelliae]|nr:hypothetical protein NHQ30_010147 [Ciborinia camelliae]
MYSSYLNSITSKVTSIRQNIFSGETDGDTEDDTYLCRVMRTYYLQEKKQSLPAWLPADPRGPPPSPGLQPVYSQPVGSTYGQAPAAGGGSQGLNSLFGGAPGRTNAASPPPGSLRAARGTGGPAARSQSPFANQGPPAPTGGLSARDRLKMGRSKGSAMNTNAGGSGMGGDPSYDSGDKPFVAATSPWASNEAEFGGGAYEPPAPRRGMGLPSGGPAAGRRPGLPNGPRSGR